MFGDPSDDNSSPALVVDLILAIWTAVIITFVTAPFAFLFTRSGPANMAHSVIDQAHITAQQNRINTLIARLNAQWIQTEPEETGNEFICFLRPESHSHSLTLFCSDEPLDFAVMKEKWGKGNSVPDTQTFKMDFTKSAKYHKRKIKIKMRPADPVVDADPPVVRTVSPAWDAPAAPKSPAPLAPLTLTAAKRNLSRLGVVNSNKKRLPSLTEEKAVQEPEPTFVLQSRPARNSSSTDMKALRTGLPKPKTAQEILDTHVKDGEEEALRVARARSTTLPSDRSDLIEEGYNYQKLVTDNAASMQLVGTVRADGTVGRRWFCCTRPRRGSQVAAAQEVVDASLTAPPKQTTSNKLSDAVTEVIRDRVRRSHRNARFHRFRGVTPGIVHHGGGPDMDELRDGEMLEVRALPLLLPQYFSTLLCSTIAFAALLY
jgi:hypothetical protein